MAELGLGPRKLFQSLYSWSLHPVAPLPNSVSSIRLGGSALSSGIGVHGAPPHTHATLICSSLPRPCTAPSRMKNCSGPCEFWGCVVGVGIRHGGGLSWRGQGTEMGPVSPGAVGQGRRGRPREAVRWPHFLLWRCLSGLGVLCLVSSWLVMTSWVGGWPLSSGLGGGVLKQKGEVPWQP